jgi:hypothetical protein
MPVQLALAFDSCPHLIAFHASSQPQYFAKCSAKASPFYRVLFLTGFIFHLYLYSL